jgi:alpha-methylacyl-CoA racemase
MGRRPLSGVRVLEMGGIGPVAFSGMILADLGAEVARVDRPGFNGYGKDILPQFDVLNRGKLSVELNLKDPAELSQLRRLVGAADVLIEGFRPGVMERLGVGPEPALAANPKLIYGRMTGWGQDGPLALTAGHDINYIGLTGALYGICGPGVPPQVPMNVVGDMGGGGTYLVIGVLAALSDVARTGAGRVIDAAIVDGTNHLMSLVHAMLASGSWQEEHRGHNVISGGVAPYYSVYETSDGGFVAVGCVEPKFYAEMLRILDVDLDPADQYRRELWPAAHALLASVFAKRARDDWAALFEGTDACVTPVLTIAEAAGHPHIARRRSLVHEHGMIQAGPAPRLSGEVQSPPAAPPSLGEHTSSVLRRWTE